MRPNFALDFRDTGIALLHRSTDGWRELGLVQMDAPDMAGALDDLRADALTLAPDGFATKLLIPNSQILYTEAELSGDPDTRDAEIRAALEGRTPYAVDELVYDASGDGHAVTLAVLARDTLAEAQDFAMQHRMNPVSFAATPPEGTFDGEAWFGPSGLASSWLAPGERLERDDAAVVVTAYGLPVEEPVAELVADEPIQPPAPPETEPTPAEVPPASVPPEDPAPAPLPEPEPLHDPAPLPDPVPVPPAFDPEPIDFPEESVAPAATPPRLTISGVAPMARGVAAARALAKAEETQQAETVEEAPMAIDVPLDDVPPRLASAEDDDLDDIPDAPGAAIRTAFASRRTPVEPLQAGLDAARKEPVIRAATAPAATTKAAPVPDLPPVRAKAKDAGARVTAPSIPGTRKRKAAKPAPEAATITPRAMAQSMTPATDFAAAGSGFNPRAMPQRGKPRFLGLILTAILLLLLALVAAWSTYYIATRDRGDTAEVQTAQASVNAGDPTADEEMLADQQDPADFAEPDVPPPPAEDVATTDAPAADEPAPAPQTGTMAEAQPATIPADGPQDEIFLATADALPPTDGVQALTAPSSTADAAPAAPAAPPPYGTVYKFDADGRVVPTAEGIVTPDGVTLIAGKPGILPPDRPASVLAAATSAAAPATPTEPAAAPEPASTLPPPDPALAGAKPRARPAGLVVPAANDGAALPATDGTVSPASSLRPLNRPQTVLAAGEAARKASASASLVNTETALASAALPPGALEISRRPAPRPRDLSRAVEAAVAAAVRQAPPPAEVQQVAAAQHAPQPPAAQPLARTEPEADDEPEVASAAPRIPVKASVAKQATINKAINLSKINLIGVYGSSSNRYALVRQSNGRYTKVKVGDTIDGGRVAAITTSEVRYQKGSKVLTLEMPKG